MKFENTEVFNFKGAFRGMRNPLESWDKSDSHSTSQSWSRDSKYIIGKNDLQLAQKLILAGFEHSKFTRQILICVDITAPLYFWKEYATYKIGTTENSTSTMHTLNKKIITKDLFEIDEETYNEAYWNIVLNQLESLKNKYNETKDMKWFRALIQALPDSFIQKRTCTLNYQIARNIYFQREYHKLKPEWVAGFCNWIDTELPYSKELITIKK